MVDHESRTALALTVDPSSAITMTRQVISGMLEFFSLLLHKIDLLQTGCLRAEQCLNCLT